MDLKKLIAAGAIVSRELVKRTVVWKHTDENNEIIETEFEVHIKKQMSAADFEFIFVGREDNEGRTCRRVSRLIFLGENGCDALSYANVCEMQWQLVLVLNDAINKVEAEFAPKKSEKNSAGEEEKN